ncbi:hypothetical protein EDD66_10637 [Mobilisporobacter senegalensis]|uniref:Uncharacterized protein n=1 Tax=Mobilisporobacter senegalensis TaxID=1329262 RepID=A0A3N1XQI0_9FIRM|nr:hypothetical protein [Mobilisporobacter senegalensis]ROR27342.1 hypothetical protein EDD66_10637 [Mobilisporobacter senegalensis]
MMNYDAITIQDCLDMYEFMDKITVIENGRVTGFEKEKKDEESNTIGIR